MCTYIECDKKKVKDNLTRGPVAYPAEWEGGWGGGGGVRERVPPNPAPACDKTLVSKFLEIRITVELFIPCHLGVGFTTSPTPSHPAISLILEPVSLNRLLTSIQMRQGVFSASQRPYNIRSLG